MSENLQQALLKIADLEIKVAELDNANNNLHAYWEQAKKNTHEADLKNIKLELKLSRLEKDVARWKVIDNSVDISPFIREYHSGLCISVDAVDEVIREQDVVDEEATFFVGSLDVEPKQ